MLNRRRSLVLIGALALFGMRASAVAPKLALTVDTGKVLRVQADHWIGIDLNYLRDSDANRPQAKPLVRALRDMGVRWLRYPGGEKSDFYEFAPPPFEKPDPQSLKWYAGVPGKRMDIDGYVRICRTVGAEPFVVVGCDNEKRTGKTWDQWQNHAVALVRYANKTRGYHIRYWEIGNENWNNDTANPEQMGQIVARFATAMKQVDPTIQIGASVTDRKDWCAGFLPVAAPQLDFLTESVYNTWGWGSYEYWSRHPGTDLIAQAKKVLHYLDQFAAPADRRRIKLIVTETNSKDYSEGGWDGGNTLGHSLVTFETFGRLLQEPRITSVMLWTTRWMPDAEAAHNQFFALGPDNQLLPAGWAVALWGRFLHERFLSTDGGSGVVSVYASGSEDNRKLSVWVVNAGKQKQENVSLTLKSSIKYRMMQVHRLSGDGANETKVEWKEFDPEQVNRSNLASLTIPPLSITVFSFWK